ncbi:MAG TPA: filamentous hemagglutinin N-terminal domain-containing protein, partial [Rhodocyclaceae bacterium]|nr:filamentous hemagglutinin N-terminal domain-containing protein [Rhodocyclaceae bacterium]
MNRCYRSLYNATLGTWVAAPETAKAHGKAGKNPAVVAAVAIAAALAAAPALALDGNALPTGGQVSAGSGNLASSGNTLTVTQTSGKLAVDWQSFNVGQAATVNFVQPSASAIALNRIVGSDPSQIYGRLNANGQVFLLNPNGVLFGKGAEVNVGGLVATTLSLANADFLAGNYRFTGTAGRVVNQGSITAADHGYIALLGGQVSNQGTLVAKLGNVSLAAGRDITLDFAGDGLINLQVNQGAVNALAENQQLIRADGGTVLMTAKAADSLIQAVVNNEGVIEARGIDTRGGTIKLLADMDNGTVQVGGTLDALAQGGQGGFIETSGQTLAVRPGAQVVVGTGGKWLIDPTDLTIDAATAGTIATALAADGSTVEQQASHDITVASPVAWTSTGTLTLNAGNNIAINADINASRGTLKLYYGGGYYLNNGAQVTLSAGSHFYTKLGSNAESAWTVITALGNPGSTTGTDLQG